MAEPENYSNPVHATEAICQELLAIAEQQSGNSITLLAMLRQLEAVHRQICEDHFYATLPERRRDLYNVLRDIEENGGWPYIARPKLRFILDNMFSAESEEKPLDVETE
jgi:hypothetical protein